MSDVLKAIRQRQSMRVPFDSRRPVGKRILEQIIEAARWAPTPHNMQNFEIVVVDDRRKLREIGRVTSRVSEDFLRENYQQLSFSEEELARKRVGILGTMFPKSWVDPSGFEAVARGSARGPLERTINGSPTLLIVVYDPAKRAPASVGDFLGVLGLGCVMENMWLAAQSLGIGVQVLSVFRGEPVEEEVKRILRIPERLRIAYALRLGYVSRAPGRRLRVRRDVETLAHRNKY